MRGAGENTKTRVTRGFSALQVRTISIYLRPHSLEELPPVKPRVFLTLRFLATFLIFSTVAGLVTWVGGLRIVQTWPFFLGAAGFAGLLAGIRKRHRFSVGFTIPSMVFIALSGFFCLFSFHLIPMRLKDFILMYWPAIPVVSLACLFLSAFFFGWRRRAGRGKNSER